MIDIEKLNDDQLRIVDKIEREATSQGLDPRFALAIANIETGGKYQHTVGKKVLTSPKGALGVMQLMPKTAKGLGVNPLDEDDNIRGGVTLLKQLMDEHNDPIKAAVGYNASIPARSKFYKSGDFNDLPQETLLYVDKLEKLYPLEGEAVQAEAAKEPVEELALPPVSSELPASLNEPTPEPLLVDPKTGALVGTSVGFTAGAVEKGKDVLSRRQAPPVEPTKGPIMGSPGQKWSAKTGFGRGEGETVREVSEAFQRAKNKGKVSSRIPVGGTLNIHEWFRQKEMAEELARRAAQSEIGRNISKTLGKIPLGSTLAGLGAGLDVAEAAKRYQEDDLVGVGISGLSALGQAAMLVPHPATRIGGALMTAGAMPADYIYKVMRENEKRKKKGLLPITKPIEEIEYDPMGNPIR